MWLANDLVCLPCLFKGEQKRKEQQTITDKCACNFSMTANPRCRSGKLVASFMLTIESQRPLFEQPSQEHCGPHILHVSSSQSLWLWGWFTLTIYPSRPTSKASAIMKYSLVPLRSLFHFKFLNVLPVLLLWHLALFAWTLAHSWYI